MYPRSFIRFPFIRSRRAYSASGKGAARQYRFSCLVSLLGLLLASSCALHGAQQERAAAREPQFHVQAIEAASLGTLDVLPLRQPADVDLPRRNQLIQGYVRKNLSLKMTVSLQACNPNPQATLLTGLVYTVLIDGKPLGSGRQAVAAELPANGALTLPLSFELNTYKLLGDDALPALRNFALGFGDPRRERLTLRVRPLLQASRSRWNASTRLQPLLTTAEGASYHPYSSR